MFLLSAIYYFTREAFLTPLILSFVISASAIFVALWYVASSPLLAFMGGIILLFSRSFIDFSSSGLENPLTHLLLAFFVLVYLPNKSMAESLCRQKQLFYCSLIAGLLMLNRMDVILLIAPALALLWWRSYSWRSTAIVILGGLPFLLWTIFSIIYYGFALPNTAYAKLGAGVSAYELIKQGVGYYIVTFQHDPVTLAFILGAIIATFLSARKEKIALAIGALLYLFYILRIGGCFMAGRFFTPVLFLMTLLAMRSSLSAPAKSAFITIAAVLCLSSYGPHLPIQNDINIAKKKAYRYKYGIMDERSCYFQNTGLITYNLTEPSPRHPWARKGRALKNKGQDITLIGEIFIGMLGTFAGPRIFIGDDCALTEPLLARLPVKNNAKWRIGHFRRRIPMGYAQSVELDRNLLENKDLASYYDHIRSITRAPIFSKERWKSIVKINSGQLDHLIKCYSCNS